MMEFITFFIIISVIIGIVGLFFYYIGLFLEFQEIINGLEYKYQLLIIFLPFGNIVLQIIKKMEDLK